MNVTIKEFREKRGISAQYFGHYRRLAELPEPKGTTIIVYDSGTKTQFVYDVNELESWLKKVGLKKPIKESKSKKKQISVVERFDNAMARLFISQADEIRPRKEVHKHIKKKRINTRIYGYSTF